MNRSNLYFVSIGKSHVLCANKVWAIVRPNTATNKRVMALAKKEGRYLDWTSHNPVKSLILMDDNTVIGCLFSVNTVFNRIRRELNMMLTEPMDATVKKIADDVYDEIDDEEAEIDDESESYEDYVDKREGEDVLSEDEFRSAYEDDDYDDEEYEEV